jgi:SWIM zinc finger
LRRKVSPAYTKYMEEMHQDVPRHRLYGLAAEIRAVEEGHNARVMPDGSILVKAESTPGSYRVSIRGVDDGVLRFGCSCRSGQYRTSLPIPCKHAALAARRMEREGLARWVDGN